MKSPSKLQCFRVEVQGYVCGTLVPKHIRPMFNVKFIYNRTQNEREKIEILFDPMFEFFWIRKDVSRKNSRFLYKLKIIGTYFGKYNGNF